MSLDPEFLRQVETLRKQVENARRSLPSEQVLEAIKRAERDRTRLEHLAEQIREPIRQAGSMQVPPALAEAISKASTPAISPEILRQLRTPTAPLVSPDVLEAVQRFAKQRDQFGELYDRLQAMNTVATEAAEEAEVPAEPVPEAEAEQGRTWLANLSVGLLIALLHVALGTYDEAMALAEQLDDRFQIAA